MKADIFDKNSKQPVLGLDEDAHGMVVTHGNPALINQLGLSRFTNVKQIVDFINGDPNGQFTAQAEEEEEAPAGADIEDQLKPALDHIKDLMTRVKERHDNKENEDASATAEGRATKSMGAQAIAGLNDQIYVSLDGDNIGNAVARAEETDDEATLAEISSRINSGQTVLKVWAERMGGRVVEQGGDEGLVKVPRTAMDEIENLREQYEQAVGATASVGVGNKISESTKARMLAKLKGKNRTVIYDESTPKQLEMLMDDTQDESKKMRLAMRPNSVGAVSQPQQQESVDVPPQPQESSGGAAVAPSPEGPADSGGGAQAQAQPGPNEAEAAPPEQPQRQLDPEVLRRMKENSMKKSISSKGNAFHDPDIEDTDFSYSDDPEFSKALRYALKHGGGKRDN